MNTTPAAATATEQLNRALLSLAVQRRRTPCDSTDRHLWLSDNPAERATAAERCTPCPVIGLCGESAEARDEQWGVWGGIDRSNRRSQSA